MQTELEHWKKQRERLRKLREEKHSKRQQLIEEIDKKFYEELVPYDLYSQSSSQNRSSSLEESKQLSKNSKIIASNGKENRCHRYTVLKSFFLIIHRLSTLSIVTD
jgi:hypothetical protein